MPEDQASGLLLSLILLYILYDDNTAFGEF